MKNADVRDDEGSSGGWPTQARFWLEWGCSHVTDIVPINELDCPHAMGTNTFSPQRADSFHHILLLPPPHSTPSLRSVAQGRLRLLTTDEAGESSSQHWSGCGVITGFTFTAT